MQTLVMEIIEQWGYTGVFFMMLVENLFPPIPSEVILPFAGFMTTATQLTVTGVVITATTGSVLGAIILYGVGKFINVEQMEKIVDKWGHIIRINKADVHKADDWFNRYGYWTVFFCRMVPLVRSLISIPAGMSSMSFSLFLLLTIIGTVIWNIALILFGAILGDSWADILHFMDLYSTVIYVILSIGTVWLVILFMRKQRNKKDE